MIADSARGGDAAPAADAGPIGIEVVSTYHLPGAAASQDRLALAWSDSNAHDPRFALFDPGGQLLGTVVEIATTVEQCGLCPVAWNADVAAGLGGFGMTWNDTSEGSWNGYFVLLDSSGSPQLAPTRLNAVAEISHGGSAVISSNSDQYAVAFYDQSGSTQGEVHFTAFDAAGALDIPALRISQGDSWVDGVAIASSRDRHAVVWSDRRSGSGEIYYALIESSGGSSGETRLVAETGVDHFQPSVSCDGERFVVAWVRDAPGGPELRTMPLLETWPDSSNLVSAQVHTGGRPALAYSGARHGVAWMGPWGAVGPPIFLVELDESGVAVGGVHQVTDDGAGALRPLWLGSGWAVMWQDVAVTRFAHLP